MKELVKIRKKSLKDLKIELIALFREQFNLRIRAASGKLKQAHLLRQVRRKIAQLKTILSEKENFK